jgi:hypothetical protein
MFHPPKAPTTRCCGLRTCPTNGAVQPGSATVCRTSPPVLRIEIGCESPADAARRSPAGCRSRRRAAPLARSTACQIDPRASSRRQWYRVISSLIWASRLAIEFPPNTIRQQRRASLCEELKPPSCTRRIQCIPVWLMISLPAHSNFPHLTTRE